VTTVAISAADYRPPVRALLERVRGRRAGFEALLKQADVTADLSKLPVDPIAEALGRSVDVSIAGEAGTTMICRSNLGPPLPTGGSTATAAIVAAIAIPGLLRARIASNERNAAATLKSLVTSEENFRANDLDGNGVNDYWVGDLSGLGRIPRSALFDPALPGADRAPIPEGREAGGAQLGPAPTPAPKAGYWFQVVPQYEGPDGEARPYSDGKNRNVGRFAFCAYPAAWDSTGNHTFFVDENAMVWRKDQRGEPLKVVPRNPAAAGWAKVE
jgi:hypothetical protein